MNKRKVSPIQQRAARLEVVPMLDQTGAMIRAALSSSEPVARWFGTEILEHSAAAIDLSRAAGDGLPLTVNHSERDPTSPALPVGRVRGVHLAEDGKLRGELDFDTDEQAEAVRGKVERGIARDVSLTYRVLAYEGPNSDEQITVTRWMPLAAPIVTLPADATVGVGRGATLDEPETPTMPDETTPAPGDGASTILERAQERTAAGFAAGAAAERERLNAIDEAAALATRGRPDCADALAALASEARADGSMNADRFRSAAFALIGEGVAPLNPPAPAATREPGASGAPGNGRRALVVPGSDARDNAARGIELALMERAGVRDLAPEALAGNRYRGWPMLDCMRELLELHGHDVRGLNSEQIAKAAIEMRAVSGAAQYATADFPAVTENVITKRVHDAYMEAEVTWDRWCSVFEVADFKQFTIPRISQVLSLPVVAENDPYTNLTQADAKESATLVKRGGLMSFSWEAMVNDDMGMFGRTATRMGEAAARTVDEQVYATLTANQGAGPVGGPTMGDGNQLFSAPHANVGSAALDLAGIVATRTAIARQTDDNSVLLGLVLRHLIVPEELRDAADNLAGSEYIPWVEGATPQSTRINTVRGTFQVTSTVRLTDVNDWFAASAAGGTMEVAFLAGNRNPALEREMGWDRDALHFKVRHPFIAYPVDWRGLYWNAVT